MYKVRWISIRMFQGWKIGFTYTLPANLVCFQLMVYFGNLVHFILLRSLFYRGDRLIISPTSQVIGVQMMLIWMQGQKPWTMTQWQCIYAIMTFEV
jgi:hypothetical protein